MTIFEAKREVRKAESVFVPRELPAGLFNVILADPPWRYEFCESDSRKIENQYPTMTLEEICALQIPAAEDAILFLWATAPKVIEAGQVIDAWGFKYRTHAVWFKDKIGTGYWFRGQHEPLMVAIRGQWSPPPAELRHSSVIEAPRTKHSEKPAEVYELIERMYPENVNRLELFARRSREGWKSWGNEVKQ